MLITEIPRLVNPSLAEGRLTSVSGASVPATDQSSVSVLYYTPHAGNRIALWQGNAWGLFEFGAPSVALSGLTASRVYDVFAYNNAGAVAIELGAIWPSDRTGGAEIERKHGVWVKSADHTRRLIGTICTTGTTTTRDTAACRYVCNAENLLPRPVARLESTASWTQGSSGTGTWRQANTSSANQIDVVGSVPGSGNTGVHLLDLALNTAFTCASANIARSAIGYNSTSAIDGVGTPASATGSSAVANLQAFWRGLPVIGNSYFAWLEQIAAAAVYTWYGFSSGAAQYGLTGWYRC